MIVISDTSPITNLAAIGYLDLLHQLYNSLIIPGAVYHELVNAQSDSVVPGAVEVQTLPWIQKRAVVDSQKVEEILANQTNIDRGEAEAIVLSMELNADLILMDERRGRALASSYGIKVTGLLGILLQAKHQGAISTVKPLIDRLTVEAKFRISPQLYQTVLELAGE